MHFICACSKLISISHGSWSLVQRIQVRFCTCAGPPRLGSGAAAKISARGLVLVMGKARVLWGVHGRGICRNRQGENKKQGSRQQQCEVPCGIGNVINSSLFINSSLSSLSSTSHAVHRGVQLCVCVCVCVGSGHGGRLRQGEGVGGGGGG